MAVKKETPKKFYGWRMAVIAGLVYFCSGDAVLPTATIVNPIMLTDSSMELNGTILGLGFSLFVLMQGIPGPFIGHLIERKGARFAMVLGASIMAVGALAMIFVVRSPFAYLLFFGVVLSVGSIMAGLLSVQTTVSHWFTERRGLAMTITMSIAGVGGIIVPLIARLVVGASGGAWQSGWILVLVMAAILVPTALFLVKNKPEEVGQYPDGIEPVALDETAHTSSNGQESAAQRISRVFKNRGSIPFKTAVKSIPFWLIALAGTGGFAAYTLATSQGVIHFSSLGFGDEVIVPAVMSMGLAGLAGRFIIGMQADRFEPARLMSVGLTIVFAGILCGAFANGPVMVFLYYLCNGFGFGSVTTLLPTAVANYFGMQEFSKNLGTTMLITTLVASTIPVMGGAIFDFTGSVTPAFVIVAGMIVLCILAGLAVRYPKGESLVSVNDEIERS